MLKCITIILIFILGVVIGMDLSKNSIEYNCNTYNSVVIKKKTYICTEYTHDYTKKDKVTTNKARIL